MKLHPLLYAAALTCSTPAASAQWSKTDSLLQGAWLALHSIDYMQTRDIAHRCRTTFDATETNPILGSCPQPQTVAVYFASTAYLHTVAAHIMPAKFRRLFHVATLGTALYFTTNNAALGINLRY